MPDEQGARPMTDTEMHVELDLWRFWDGDWDVKAGTVDYEGLVAFLTKPWEPAEDGTPE